MPLEEGRLYEKPGFTAAAATDYKDVFIPGILWVLRTTAHCQPFRLRQNDVVIRVLIDIWLDIRGRSPSGRAVFHSLPEFLGILLLHVDKAAGNKRTCETHKKILRMQARQRVLKCSLEVGEYKQQFFPGQGSLCYMVEPTNFIDEIPNDEIREAEDQMLFDVVPQSCCPRSFDFSLTRSFSWF